LKKEEEGAAMNTVVAPFGRKRMKCEMKKEGTAGEEGLYTLAEWGRGRTTRDLPYRPVFLSDVVTNQNTEKEEHATDKHNSHYTLFRGIKARRNYKSRSSLLPEASIQMQSFQVPISTMLKNASNALVSSDTSADANRVISVHPQQSPCQ
jgi:hypothetical protein